MSEEAKTPEPDKPVETKELVTTKTGRVEITTEAVVIGDKHIRRKSLLTWRGWDAVTALAKKIDPPLNAEELRQLRIAADNTGGRNGYAEMLSALRGMGKA